MRVTDAQRKTMDDGLRSHMGEELGDLVIMHLPVGGCDELAQKSDIALVRSDVVVLKTDVEVLKSDVGQLKDDVRELKTDVTHLKDDVRELKTDVAEVKVHLAFLDKAVNGLEKRLNVVITLGVAIGLAMMATQTQIILTLSRL